MDLLKPMSEESDEENTTDSIGDEKLSIDDK